MRFTIRSVAVGSMCLVVSGFLALKVIAQGSTSFANLNERKHFDRVVVVFLENQGYAAAVAQPFFKDLITRGALLSNFYAETHPSQPNYIAFAAGTTRDVVGDANVDLSHRHLGDLLEDKGLTWKNYAEAFPSPCFKGRVSRTYARKHVPFISFTNVNTNPERCKNIVSASTFIPDVVGGQLPHFSFYTPDMNNDGHDTGIAYAAKAMEKTFGPLLADQNLLKSTLFVFTFDEDDGSNSNRIFTAFIGAGVRPGSVSNQRYSHYDLLRTIEDEFDLGTLTQNDLSASAIDGIWQ